MGYLGMVKNLQGAGLNAVAGNHIVVPALLDVATWNTAASHEVFTVTGLVRVRMWIECVTTLQDAADAADIQCGVEGATNALTGRRGRRGRAAAR